MNLSDLIKKQRELLDCIVTEKQLQEEDLIKDTFLALQVEMAEFANEGRWFKYWSKNKEPRTEKIVKCHACRGIGKFAVDIDHFIVETETCGYCDGTGLQEDGNPLLEEYIDSFHFFLQIAILMGWEDVLWIYQEQLDSGEFDGNLSDWYLEMTYFLNKSYFENPNQEQSQKWERHFGFPEKQYHFRTAWILFLNLGMNGFGFTWNQICDAYMDKNNVNHDRQINGY